MNVKLAFSKSRARALEDVLESWQFEHREAMKARDVEDLISECAACCGELAAWYDSTRRDLFENRIRDPGVHGQIMLDAFDHVLRLLPKVENIIQSTVSTEYGVDGIAAFRSQWEKLTAARRRLSHEWPLVDLQEVEQGRAEIRAGRSCSAEEYLRELQGAAE